MLFEKVDNAEYPCALLDDKGRIVQTSQPAKYFCISENYFAGLLTDADRAKLANGEGIRLTGTPDAGEWALAPTADGVYAVRLGSSTDFYQDMMQGLTWKLQGLFCAFPVWEHFSDGKESDEMRRYALRQTYGMMRTLKNLQWKRQIEAGLLPEAEALEINLMLKEYCEAVATLFRHVTVSYEGTDELTYVKISQKLMEVIMGQLLNNAIRYGSDKCYIRVRAQKTARRVCVTVSDNGKGIRPELVDRVFDAGFSMDPYADSEEQPGDGIGLTLVKGCLRQVGGECALQSEWGKGTTVSFSLPEVMPDTVAAGGHFGDYLLDRLSPVMIQFGSLVEIDI